VRKAVSLTLVAALALGLLLLRPALADSPKAAKPVIVVSLASYDELMGDLKFVGDLADHPDLDKNVEAVLKLFTKGRGLVGVDKQRPCGAVIAIGDGKPTGYGFMPVTDLKELLTLLENLGHESRDAGDGIIEIDTKQENKRLFVRQKEGWAFLADKPEALADTADDPAQLIAGLPEQYDWAVRLNVCNVPEECRQKLVERLKKRARRDLKRMKGTEEEKTIAKMVARKIVRVIDAATDEIEQITLGCALDHNAKTASLEVTVTALEGTGAAKQFAELKQAKTSFAGFQLPGAALSGGAAFQSLVVSAEEATAFFNAVQAAAFKHVEAKIQSEEDLKGAKEFISGMLGVASETVASGRVDRRGSLVLKPDAVTLVAGRYVADGPKLEQTLGLLVEAARKKHPDAVDKLLKPNAEECKGIKLHVVSIPIPDQCKDRDKAVRLVGENLEVVVGIGEQCVCCAAGKDALNTLKQAIEQSDPEGQQADPPVQFSVSLGQVADFIAEVAKEKDKPTVEKIAALLKENPDKDHVTAVATPIERGVKCRLELEQGVLKLLAEAQKLKKK